MRIQILPSQIANQIAAGEVIERPASIVKELLENSLDAKATRINIEIMDSGFQQIKISDDGVGICAEDLPLAIAPHATSKIRQVQDLNDIRTLGFRGEALASIAAISKLTLHSKTVSQSHGMQLLFKEGHPEVIPWPRNQGTTVEVRDIFFNVPVRKKFLKSARFEFLAIDRIVRCFALSAPTIHLTFSHNGRNVLHLPAALSMSGCLSRLQRLLGKNFMSDAAYLEESYQNLQLSGWISRREHQRSQNDRQWVYVNGRMVKDKLLNHAVKISYQNLVDPGRYPVCVLYLKLQPEKVDVNVHPTKHEVRFQDPRTIHNFICTTLTTALETSMDQSVSGSKNAKVSALLMQDCSEKRQIFTDVQNVQEEEHSQKLQSDLLTTNSAYKPKEQISHNPLSPVDLEEFFNRYKTNSLKKNTLPLNVKEKPLTALVSNEKSSWLNLNEKFALIFFNDEPFLVDVYRLKYDCLKFILSKEPLPFASRLLSVPIRYTFEQSIETNSFNHYQCLLEKVGIQLTLIGENVALVRSLPSVLPHLQLQALLKDLFKTMPEFLNEDILVEKLAQHDTFNPYYLSNEEKQTLLMHFANIQGLSTYQLPPWAKYLSLPSCEKWLNG
ncbi:MAG: DNA mismatch repair endonuclease MutL [Legionella sp.]|nr:DNA mismatch repair endonuclease MutL [Legionella sp.]